MGPLVKNEADVMNKPGRKFKQIHRSKRTGWRKTQAAATEARCEVKSQENHGKIKTNRNRLIYFLRAS